MSTILAKALSTKQKADSLSTEALAKTIGVSTVSVRGVLKGTSKPNKATASKYATYLGLSETDIGGEPKAAKSDAKSAGKATGKKAAKSAGKKPAKASKPRAAKAGKASKEKAPKSSSQTLSHTLQQAVHVLSDKLAVTIHGADKATRDLISRILGV